MHLLKINLIIIFFSAVICHAQTCPKSEFSNNNFITIQEKINDVKTYTDLKVESFNDTSKLHNTKLVMGLTLGSISLNADFKIRYQKTKDKYCAWLEKINVKYSLDSLDVYIPKDFKPGTCRYEEVKKHEFEHVKIYKDTYNEYLTKLKNKLFYKNSISKPQDAVLVSNVSEAEQIFKEDITRILNEFHAKLIKVMNNRQKAIDTEENYKTIASRCLGWSDIISE